MTTMLRIPAILPFVLFFSCVSHSDRQVAAIITTDSLQTEHEENKNEQLIKLKKEQDSRDSLSLDKLLTEALKIANHDIKKDKFRYKYEVMMRDSVSVDVEINLGRHFTKANPHLIIRRYIPEKIYLDIFCKVDNKFKHILSHQQWTLEYINDTIRDINGDGLKDFVVNWYGVTGCCLKAFSNVYLLRPDSKSFSDNFEFINPTFSPGEKVVRGVSYGHPGETEMYKYKWNGDYIDTLEYVYYEKNEDGLKTGKIIVTADGAYGKKRKTLKALKAVPGEYRKIDGYDWFVGLPNH